MFDRFTVRARKVMGLARQEATKLDHDYIGVEHILLGISEEGSGVGANALRNLAITTDRLRGALTALGFTQGKPQALALQSLPFTPYAKELLERACESAQALNHKYVGTEHLLIGAALVMRDTNTALLAALDLTTDEVEAEVIALVGGVAPKESIPTEPTPDTDSAKIVSSANRKLQITFDPAAYARLKLLCQKVKEPSGNTPTSAQVVARALRFYEWYTDKAADGAQFLTQSKSGQVHAVEFIFP